MVFFHHRSISYAHYFNDGKTKYARGDWVGAITDFNKAIELEPDNADAYGVRGSVELIKGELDGALADCNKAIELNPKDAPSYAIRGGVKYKKGDTNGAQADFKTAIELNPKMRKIIETKGYLIDVKN
jgi:tetratricopeptide (TPR) repeat protein